jgi:hypothetical protein
VCSSDLGTNNSRRYEFVTGNIRDDAGKVRRTALRDERIAAMKAGKAAQT